MKKLFVTIVVALVLSATQAVAGDKWDGNKPGNGVGASSSISWDEFKLRCTNPEQFDVQRAPQNIRVQCTDATIEYVAAPAGSVQLAGSRMVMTAVLADKFHVAAGARDVPIMAKAGSCLRFKEIEKSLTIERPLSCGDILSIKGDVNDYCIASVDAAKAANPKLLEVRDTGRVIDTCGSLAQGGGDGKGGQK